MLEGLGSKQVANLLQTTLAKPSRYGALLTQARTRLFMPREETAPFPSSAMVEPIARCNLKCPECPVGRGELGRTGEMSLDAFAELWKMWRGKIAHVLLFNQGEPLMVRHFDQIAQICASTKTYSLTSTNATLLAKNDWPERLVHSGLTELILSIDGTTQDTFELYRVGGRLEKVIEGVQALRKARDANGGRGPILTMQMLLAKTNERQWQDAPEFAKKIGCDGMVFKTMQIERLNDPVAKHFLPTKKEFWRYSEDEAGQLQLRRKWIGCGRLWWHPVVHADGELVPCCFDKTSEHSYGNVFKDGFAAVWNGEKARKFRRQFIDSKAPPLPMCENCTEGLWRVELLPKEVENINKN